MDIENITQSILNKSSEEAEIILNEFDMSLRVMEEDGESLFGTCDYDESRVNVAVTNNIVVEVFNVG